MRAASNAKPRLVSGIALVLTAILTPTIAHSQEFVPFMGSTLSQASINAVTTSTLQNIYMQNAGVSSPAATSYPNNSSPNNSSSTTQSVSLTFHSDPNISHQVQSAFIDSIRQRNPPVADKLAPILTSGQLLNAYSREATAFGLQPNNIADAMTIDMIVRWMIANNVQSSPSPAAIRGVRSQVAQACQLDPALRSESARQMLTETIVYQSMLLQVIRQQVIAKGDPTLMRQFSDGVKDSASLRRMELTDAGFRPRC